VARFTRRNWFLERVLKLGLTPVAKEYQCVCRLCSTAWKATHPYASAQLVPIQPIVPVRWKKSGDKRITLSLDLVSPQSFIALLPIRSMITGPCQPSMVYRYLRTLEGISPPLSLTHLACQNTARAFVATRELTLVDSFLLSHRALVFDRMFSLGLRGSGADITAPVTSRVATPGPRRHFLYCCLKPEKPTFARNRRSRELLS
jgi:hypothetical protein